MSKKILFLLLGFALTGLSFQQPTYRLIKQIPLEAYFLGTDNIGNAYVLSMEHDLNKYRPDGSFYTTQNIKVNGNISSIDVSNVLQVNLFYRNLNKVVILDNLLAFRGEVLFQNLGIVQASASARSFDNGIWVFDQSDLQLKKIDKDLKKITQQSGNVRMFTERGTELNPNFILDNGQRVYVNNALSGILVFDIFAQYIKTIPLKGLDHFQVMNDQLVYYQNGKLQRYNLRTFKTANITMPDTVGVLDARLEKDRLYLLKKNGVTLYAY